jgi:hypothetical protein
MNFEVAYAKDVLALLKEAKTGVLDCDAFVNAGLLDDATLPKFQYHIETLTKNNLMRCGTWHSTDAQGVVAYQGQSGDFRLSVLGNAVVEAWMEPDILLQLQMMSQDCYHLIEASLLLLRKKIESQII